ncbi:DUF6233 domain-containing protein, partial [Streptomyces nigra]|uniref:DUF6233 domain-containing protein n=1 Tax=Streptomyces nigra TaxID=1827580 RepID=UPI0036944E45
MGADRSPVQVHAGDCHMAGERRRAVSRDEARRLLATGLEGCSHCRPAARLHIIDLELRTKVEPGSRRLARTLAALPEAPGSPAT